MKRMFLVLLLLAAPTIAAADNLDKYVELLRSDLRTVKTELLTEALEFKGDEGAKFETFVPECEDASEANEELRAHLSASKARGPFILQERKDGVEQYQAGYFAGIAFREEPHQEAAVGVSDQNIRRGKVQIIQ